MANFKVWRHWGGKLLKLIFSAQIVLSKQFDDV